MIDYYEELNLNPEESAADISRALNQLESTWKRREINNPEKATKILAVILDAREAFKSETTKAEYDRNLEESKKPSEPYDYDAERKAQFQYYRAQAEEYYFNNKQPDLALEAVKKAFQYQTPDSMDGAFLFLSSLIRYDAGDLDGALSDVTSAISVDSSKASYYVFRAEIFGDFFNAAISDPNDFQTARKYLAQNKLNYEKALEIAKQNGDREIQIASLEALAESYSLIYDSDFERAENYAKQAQELGDTNVELQRIMENIREARSELQPYQGKSHPTSRSSGGACYIATAVYGSYDCPEVWTLRRYRDTYLSTFALGRLFIKIYYFLSPRLIRLCGKNRLFICLWKRKLDKFVSRLREAGYSSDRYYD